MGGCFDRMCGADDCSTCHPGRAPECDECDGGGCPTCAPDDCDGPYDDDYDPDPNEIPDCGS